MSNYIKLFDTEQNQNIFRDSGDYTQPHVSCLRDGSNLKYNRYKKKYWESLDVPFTIEATQDGTTVYFRQSSFAVNDGLDPLKVEVSTDNGDTWTEVTAAPAEDDAPGAILAELDAGEKVLIRGNNEAYGCVDAKGGAAENCNFYADSPCYIYGNIMSLIGGDDFARLREVKEYAFAFFFSDSDEELYLSWVLLKEDNELLLPATTLAECCYFYMFSRCTGLTTAPTLPATTLAESCYSGMFADCNNLATAPSLPATALASNCYMEMFSRTGLIAAPELPATILAEYCYRGMFDGCTSLTSAPELPAMILAEGCYSRMFGECENLTSAPELPATTLASNCYNFMFYGCANLSYIKAMFTTTPSNSYTQIWVLDVNSTGTFVKNSAASWNVTGDNGVPTGWTVETASA